MPKKSRKWRVKHKTRGSPKLLAVKEASQHPQLLPISSKQAPVAMSPTAMAEQAGRYQYMLSDLKRAFAIAGALLVLLIALYFLLH